MLLDADVSDAEVSDAGASDADVSDTGVSDADAPHAEGPDAESSGAEPKLHPLAQSPKEMHRHAIKGMRTRVPTDLKAAIIKRR